MASLIDLHTHTSHSSACSHMTAEELIGAAIEAGLDGVAVTEHLVIEVQNSGCKPQENDQAAELARILALPGIGGSDAHSTAQVGRSATWFPNRIRTDADLVAALKQGGYRASVRRRKGT